MNRARVVVCVLVVVTGLVIAMVAAIEDSSQNLQWKSTIRETSMRKWIEFSAVKRWGWNRGKQHGRSLEIFDSSVEERFYRNDMEHGVWTCWIYDAVF